MSTKKLKPTKLSLAGGSVEPGTNEVANPQSMKEVLKRIFNWDDKTLNLYKDFEVERTFFNNLNVRKILMTLGTEIGRETHADLWVLNHVENLINKIDAGEEIKPLVSVSGLAGHGKDFQLSLLEGDFIATGDVRFQNELKFVLIVNEFRNNPKRLREELVKISEGFTFDPELLEVKFYTHFMGTGTENLQNEIIDQIINSNAKSSSDLVEIYNKLSLSNEKMPTLHELLYKMRSLLYKDWREKFPKEPGTSFRSYIKDQPSSDPIAAVFRDVLIIAADGISKNLSVNMNEVADMLFSDLNMDYFHYEFTNEGISVLNTDFYKQQSNGEWIEWIKPELELYNDITSKLEKYEENDKLEYLKFVDLYMEDFLAKMDFFNPKTHPGYANGPVDTNISMNKKDYSNLAENNIFAIFKVFEVPENIIKNSQTLDEFEQNLKDYHLKNVYKPFFDISKDYFNKSLNLLNDLSGVKSINVIKDLVEDYILGMMDGEGVLNKNSKLIEDFINDIFVMNRDNKLNIDIMIKTFNHELQKSYDRKSIYEAEINTGFKNLKNLFSDKLTNVPEKKKISEFAKLLNEYGLTRSDVRHLSEKLISTIRDNGGEIINIIPFVSSNDTLNKRITENEKKKSKKIKNNGEDRQP